MKKIGLFLVCFFTQWVVFGQITSKIDTTHIKIGEPITLTYKLKINAKDQLHLPQYKDTLQYHLEILDQKVDTISLENAQKELTQTYQITSYDAGKFHIKPVAFVVNNDTLRSKAFQIEVMDVAVDTENAKIAPNKPIMLEQYTFKDYWDKYWIYGIVALALFILAIVLVILYIRSKSKGLSSKTIKTPFDEIMDELKSLDKKKYLERDEQKEYYSHLSKAIKRYIGRVYNFSAVELLSDELVAEVAKKGDILQEDVQGLKKFLYDADLVKFAKQKLDSEQHKTYRNWTEEFAKRIKPIEVPQNLDLEKDEVTGENYRKIK